MLLDALDPESATSYRGNNALELAVERGWSDCSVITGHFHYSSVEAVGEPCHLITTLRDPVERAISLYRFTHTITDEEAGRIDCAMTNFAKAADDVTFFHEASAGVRANFSDAQARQILGQDWLHFAATGRWDDALEMAKDRVASLAGFAIVEDFERSCTYLFDQLNMPLLHIRKDNILTDRMDKGDADRKTFSTVSVELRNFLEEINKVDRKLYAFSVDLLAQRMASSAPVASPQTASG